MNSTKVTLEPRRLKTEANSTPMAPAPRITRWAGSSLMSRMWSLLSTRMPSVSRPGMGLGAEPVAMMIRLASWVSPATSTLPPPSSLPKPLSTVTLFFFMRYSMPLAFLSTMRPLRLTMASRLGFRVLASTPSMP